MFIFLKDSFSKWKLHHATLLSKSLRRLPIALKQQLDPLSVCARPCGVGKLSLNGQIENLFAFVGHTVSSHSYSTWPEYSKSSHRQYVNKWAWLCPKILYLKILQKYLIIYGLKPELSVTPYLASIWI